MPTDDTLTGPDLDRIAIGDPLATRDAIAFLINKIGEESLIRAREDGRRAPTADQDWIAFAMSMKGPRDQSLMDSHRMIARVVYVYKQSNQAIATATFTKLQIDQPEIDYYNEYDESTNYRFTPQSEGKWLCIAATEIEAVTGRSIIAVYKNGNSFMYGGDTPGDPGGEDTFPSVAGIVEMNGSTDYLEVFCFHESGANRNADGGQNTTYAVYIHLGV